MSRANYLLKCIIFFFIMHLSMVNSIAQTLKFQKVYGGYSYDYGNDLIQTPDSGYLLLCTSNSFSSSSDIYLLKVDKLGAYQWQHTYGGTEIEGASQIKFTQDSNIAIAGHTSSYLTSSYDFYLVKANLNGDPIWTKHYGTNEWDFANSMDTCADGGFILAGKTYDTGNAYSDILIVKTDANGDELWRKKIGGNMDDVANSIITITDGYLIIGNTSSYGNGGKDVYLIRIDLNGNVTSENYFGENGDDEGGDIIKKANGEIIMSCSSHSLTFPSNFNNMIIKFDLLNNSIIQLYESNYTNNVKLNSLIECNDGTPLSVGKISDIGSGFGDMFAVKLNSGFYFEGGSTYGGNFEDEANNVISTYDLGYAVIGTSNSFGLGLSNIYFVKLDTTLIAGIAPEISVDLKENTQFLDTENQLYPNPFSNSTTIIIDLPFSLVAGKQFQLSVFDQLGNELSNQVSFTSKEYNAGSALTIQNLSLTNGMYYYHIMINSKTLAQGKFTIIK